MSEDRNAQLVGIIKTMIRDHGMARTVEEITDADFHALAEAHLDEFDEARDECESNLTLI